MLTRSEGMAHCRTMGVFARMGGRAGRSGLKCSTLALPDQCCLRWAKGQPCGGPLPQHLRYLSLGFVWYSFLLEARGMVRNVPGIRWAMQQH